MGSDMHHCVLTLLVESKPQRVAVRHHFPIHSLLVVLCALLSSTERLSN
jgi:hypothetical protein